MFSYLLFQKNILLYNVDYYYHASHVYKIVFFIKNMGCDISKHFCKIRYGE